MKLARTSESDNIDRFHDNVVQAYKRAQQSDVPRLKREQASLRILVKTLPPSDKKHYVSAQRLRCIKTELSKIESDFQAYMQRSAHTIFRYYEEKQQTSVGNNVANSSSVMAFFTRGIVEQTVDIGESIGVSGLSPEDSTISGEAKPQTIINTGEAKRGARGDPKGSGASSLGCGSTEPLLDSLFDQNKRYYQKYWSSVGGHLAYAQDYTFNPNVCTGCGTGEMIPQDEEGTMQCNNDACGRYIVHIVDSQKSTHVEVQNEIYYTAYVRLNHFKEILSQFQAKQSTVIPTAVIDRVRARLAKERLVTADICYTQMRHILTVLELSKYFEHIQHINAIFGVVPPKMDDELYDTLCMLFVEIQEPWARCCPPNRVNFFNYTYVLHQLLVLLDQRKYLPYLSMAADREMKDRAKQMEQDNVWKLVCKELDWLYCPVI